MNWRDHIVADSEILAGRPVIRGTRLSVDFLLGLLAEGWSEDQISANYPPVTRDAILAVFAYAAEILADEATFPVRREAG